MSNLFRICVLILCVCALVRAETAHTGLAWNLSHGPLKMDANKRNIVHADGTPFFYMADTAWQNIHMTDAEWDLYLETRRSQGFTVIQLPHAFGGNTPEFRSPVEPMWLNNQVFQTPNPAFFDRWDAIYDKIQAKGMYVGLWPFWGYGVSRPSNQWHYGQWLGNRFKNRTNIIWALGGDSDAHHDASGRALYDELAKDITIGVTGSENYDGLLMTFHPIGPGNTAPYLNNAPWLDLHSVQSGHNYGPRPEASFAYAQTPTRGLLELETKYEDIGISFNEANGKFTPALVRQAVYWSLFEGATGVAYGHHSVWQLLTGGSNPWKEAIKAPGAWNMLSLRRLMLSRPLMNRIPDDTVMAESLLDGFDRRRATRASDSSYAMVYVANGGTVAINMGKISGSTVKAWWFDPRTGSASVIGEYANTGTRSFNAPDAPSSDRMQPKDWILVLDDKGRGYGAPGAPGGDGSGGVVNQTPSVTLTSPASGTNVLAPATISLTSTASDADGTVTKVEFFSNSTKLGEDTSSPYDFTWSNVAAGSYSLTARATDNAGAVTISAARTVTVQTPGGLTAVYFDNIDFTGASISRIDGPVDFDWGNGSPAAAIGVDSFSVRWTGQVEVPATGTWTFTTTSDDGIRLWVNGVQLINAWVDQGPTSYSGSIALTAGQRYDLKLEYFENVAGAVARLAWSGPGQASQVIPRQYLAPTSGTPTNAAPTVALTAPANGATATAPGSFAINATAADSDGTIAKVEFFAGATRLGEDTSSPYDFTWSNVAAGSYSLTARATDNAGAVTTSAARTVTVQAPGGGTGTGLTAVYFDNMDFTGASISRIDAMVDFSWGDGSPAAAIGADSFSARWTGQVEAPATGTWSFTTTSDDGIRLWVNGVQLINAWVNQGPTSYSGSIALTAGQRYDLKLEYFENGGGAMARLAWSGPGQASQVIPSQYLTPTSGTPTNAAPTVALTAPANGATATAPGSFAINATATDSDGTIAKVEFFAGATKLGEDTSSPYAFTWSNVAAGSYSLTARATDNAGAVTTSAARTVTVQAPGGGGGGGTGTILREFWTGIGGGAVSDIPVANAPSGTSQLTSFEGPSDWADSYGTRVRGYLYPPTTGSYTFWIAGDDNCALYLSTNDSAGGKQLIASVPDWTNSRQWTKFSQQTSAAITLTAGQRYYIEALQKEGGGGDNLAVAWQGPGIAQQVIAGQYLAPTSGTPTNAAPTVALTAPANGGTATAPGSFAINATAADSDGTIAKVEFFAGATKLGEDTSAPYAFTWSNVAAGSYSLTARATDNAGAVTTSAVVAVTVNGAPSTAGFYRAINVNGDALTIDGNAWESKTAANYSTVGGTFENQSVTLNPATDAARSMMIRSSVWGTCSVTLSSVPNNSYNVYLYVWEDNSPATFSVSLEGSVVQANRTSGAAGTWARLGPWPVTISDGTINVSCSGGDANISGIEVWSAGGGTTPPPVTNPGTLPAPWSTADVGTVGVAGAVTVANGTWTISGSGADIWDSADGFRFASQTVSGDLEITARVVSLNATDPWAKAGVMIRESTTASSRHAMTVVTPGNGVSFQRRQDPGGGSSHTAGALAQAPYWVRISRIGTVINSYQSVNGTTWTQVGSATITMASSVQLGLAVTSHNNGVTATATFDNVLVVSAPTGIN